MTSKTEATITRCGQCRFWTAVPQIEDYGKCAYDPNVLPHKNRNSCGVANKKKKMCFECAMYDNYLEPGQFCGIGECRDKRGYSSTVYSDIEGMECFIDKTG